MAGSVFLVARKSLKQRKEQFQREAEARAVRDGEHFALRWTIEQAYGPVYFRSLQEAELRRDEIIQSQTRALPSDYFERQVFVVRLSVWIEAFANGSWSIVPDSGRSGVKRVDYVD